MNKILEKSVEPTNIRADSFFRIKIKVQRYITYAEIKNKKVSELKQYTVAELKGD